MVSVSPGSGFRSLPRTSSVFAALSAGTVRPVSFTAFGGSATLARGMVNVWSTNDTPSESRTVTSAVPSALSLPVNVRVPVLETAGCAENSAAPVLPTTDSTGVWRNASSGPPTEMSEAQPTRVCGPASSATATSAPTVNDGGSSTAAIATLTVAALEGASVPSTARYVNVSAPLRSAPGVYVKDPSAAIVTAPFAGWSTTS